MEQRNGYIVKVEEWHSGKLAIKMDIGRIVEKVENWEIEIHKVHEQNHE